MSKAEVKSVKEWAYMCMLTGKEVNPLVLISMFDREQKRKSKQLFENLLKVSDQIAISSRLLTKHKRTKYRDKMLRLGMDSYYLFHRRYIPADIYPLIRNLLMDEKIIYDEE